MKDQEDVFQNLQSTVSTGVNTGGLDFLLSVHLYGLNALHRMLTTFLVNYLKQQLLVLKTMVNYLKQL